MLTFNQDRITNSELIDPITAVITVNQFQKAGAAACGAMEFSLAKNFDVLVVRNQQHLSRD
jgi:hypothetical protein